MERDANTGMKTGAAALGGATMAAAAAVAVSLVARGALRRGGLSPDDIGVAMLAFYAAWLVVASIGLPTFLALRWLGWLRWWSCVLAGAVGGAGFVAVLSGVQVWQAGDLAFWGLIGAVGALAFWLAMRERRRAPSGTEGGDDSTGTINAQRLAAASPLYSQGHGGVLEQEFHALVLDSVRQPRCDTLTLQRVAQACERGGLSRDAFCDAYARFIAQEFARGELSYADADCAIGDLMSLSMELELSEFAMRIYAAFDAGEHSRAWDEPGAIAWQVHTLPQIMQALAEAEPGDER
ncbi:hypothetical protein PRJ39_16120 [Lysobacter enzymogenes]|uniref:hypothetical protein n=1 Tax=Lysobacter enzymogenes TaxID=69 RepID=UPI003749A51C